MKSAISSSLHEVQPKVVNCKDELEPFYSTDSVIQVFPDEYHLQTLDVLLGSFSQLQASSFEDMYKRVQEYNTRLQLYNSKIQTDLANVNQSLHQVEKEKTVALESLASLRGQVNQLDQQLTLFKPGPLTSKGAMNFPSFSISTSETTSTNLALETTTIICWSGKKPLICVHS